MSEVTTSNAILVLFGLTYLFITGSAFGRRFWLTTAEPYRSILGAGITLSLLSIGGSLVFYFSQVTVLNLCLVALLVAFLPTTPSFNFNYIKKPDSTSLTLFVLGLVSLISFWSVVITHPITNSVRSLWLIIPPFSLVTLFFSCLLSLALLKKERSLSFILFALTLFSALSLAASAFPHGYGFDPFLHRATVSHILEHGTISPKPPYYIGEYALELFAVKLLRLPLGITNAYLSPLLAALLIPALVFRSKGNVFLPLIFLPLGAFVQTTPQALAFIFATATIFTLSIEMDKTPNRKEYVAASIFALAALFAHPLAGIPAVLFILLSLSATKLLRGAVTAVMSLTLPLAFVFQSLKAGAPLNLSLTADRMGPLPLSFFFGSGYDAFGDLTYVVIKNTFPLIVLLAALSMYQNRSAGSAFFVPALASLAAFINFLILSLVLDFSYLISYERTDFALRALTLSGLFLLPYLHHIKLKASSRTIQISAAVLLAALFTFQTYGAYPRHDNYARSAGFNVRPADIDTVKNIQSYAGGRSYAVLSNQATAAAAVQEFGFQTYFPGDIFYYPIPTGGKLYSYFLEMNEKPSRETISRARSLTGADVIYFIVSDYWWDAQNIIENTKLIADHSFVSPDGSTTVFVFEIFTSEPSTGAAE